MSSVVLDSAAVLALVQGEPGGERVDALLDAIELGADVEVAISSVNWCEVLTRMQRDNQEATTEGLSKDLSALLAGVDLVPFDKAEAMIAAGYARINQALSLGDRACLALAKTLHATAWTADRFWSQCKLDVTIEQIRAD